MDLHQIKGRTAIVTGGGRGIGQAIAIGLAQAGANVIVTAAHDREAIEAVARHVEQRCGEARVLPILADVTRDDDCARVVETAVTRFGRLDILVNNAGRGMKYLSSSFLTEPPRFWEVTPQAWHMIIDTNVNGPFMMARLAAPLMVKAGWGRIVNISMNYETMRRRGFSPYGPSKAALESETIIWAQDLAGTAVTVNALLPGGATLTGMIPDGVPDQVRSALLDPAVMVPPMLWLVSPDADGITGRRLVATRWRTDLGGREAAEAASDPAGWQ